MYHTTTTTSTTTTLSALQYIENIVFCAIYTVWLNIFNWNKSPLGFSGVWFWLYRKDSEFNI